MCGIIALYSTSEKIRPQRIDLSLNSIAHRGPDGRDVYLSPNGKVGLGHVRLAIMDVAGGSQPLYNEDRSLALVANGEFYDFERIRERLIRQGHYFHTQSDSEIALHLFEDHGKESVKELRGEFAFIIYEEKSHKIMAFRDRFGIKPLYYTYNGNQLLLASEIKALFAAGIRPEWDEGNVYQSLHFAALESSTLYKNIYQLPPGHGLEFDGRKLSIFPYWDTNYPLSSELKSASEESTITEISKKLHEAIHLRTRSDVPIACYLSGGVDSSTVLAMANHITGSKIPAFTIAFDHQDFDESQLAEKMAKHVGSPFYPLRVTNQDFADVFTQAVEVADMPLYNGHAPARFILSKEVKRAGFKVVLGGEGADELFAGYHFSQRALDYSLERKKRLLDIFNLFHRLIKRPEQEILEIKEISVTLFWFAKILGFPSDLASTLMISYKHFKDIQEPQFLQRHKKTDPFWKFMHQFPKLQMLNQAPFQSVLYLWMKSHFPQYVLAAERLDMAHGVELRLPFLDHELFEITKKLPPELLYKEKQNKYLLRKIALPYVHQEIIQKQKHPFVSPPSTSGERNPLFEMVCDLLSGQSFKEIPFFKPARVSELLNRLMKMDAQARAPYDPLLYYLASLAVLKQKYKIS